MFRYEKEIYTYTINIYSLSTPHDTWFTSPIKQKMALGWVERAFLSAIPDQYIIFYSFSRDAFEFKGRCVSISITQHRLLVTLIILYFGVLIRCFKNVTLKDCTLLSLPLVISSLTVCIPNASNCSNTFSLEASLDRRS